MITVIIADDQPEVRRALVTYLTRDGRFEIVGEANDGEEVVELAATRQPDAVVMDLAMPNMDGLEATSLIAERAPETKIVVLSSAAPYQGIREKALASGAHAVFSKFTHPKKLIKAIVSAVEG